MAIKTQMGKTYGGKAPGKSARGLKTVEGGVTGSLPKSSPRKVPVVVGYVIKGKSSTGIKTQNK